MSRGIVDGTELLADDVSQWVPTADWSRAFARKLFAEIAVRIVAFGADMVLVLFGVVFLGDHVIPFIAPALVDQTAVWVVLLFGYFTACWASPLHATPMQFLLGMRVLHESGEPLSVRDAAIRSATLVALWGLVTVVFKLPVIENALIGAIVVAILIFIPAVTAHRQGLHDFLSHSVVINKRSILFVPRFENGEVRRDCRTEGDIKRRYLPGACRDPVH